MRRSVIALVAFLALYGPALAESALHDPVPGSKRLTAEEIIDFFRRDAATQPAAQPGLSSGGQETTRGLTPTPPGDTPGMGIGRSVYLGAAGFGDATAGTGTPTAGTTPLAQSGTVSPAQAGLDLLVGFDLDSARLTADARQNLDAFIAALHDPALSDLHFAVEGHTDASGPADYNLALSQRRATAVVDYLTAHGIDRARLEAQGYGETRPRTPVPEDPANRRVETRRMP